MKSAVIYVSGCLIFAQYLAMSCLVMLEIAQVPLNTYTYKKIDHNLYKYCSSIISHGLIGPFDWTLIGHAVTLSVVCIVRRDVLIILDVVV